MAKSIIVGAIVAAAFTACPAEASTTLVQAIPITQSQSQSQTQSRDGHVLASGSIWKKASNAVQGAFRFETRGEDTFLVIDRGFSTKSGPDLKFVLSPLAYDAVKSKTALQGGVIVGHLKSNTGAQEFKLPAGVDLDRYQSLLVHCEQFTKLWAAASISEGELLAHGDSWTKKSNSISGSWEIAKTDAGLVVRLGDDFRTRSAPDLKLFLASKPVRSSNGDNATSGSTLVAKLRSNRGASEYVLSGVDSLEDYDRC
jgi:hypothetical protein